MTGFTYEPDAQPYTAYSLGGGKSFDRFRARVRRSDGAIVWLGRNYATSRAAKAQAGRAAASFRTYLEQNGACWYDRNKAVKAHKTTRENLRKDTARELMGAASQGTRAAAEGGAENEAPYAWDTAQGIIWTQAFRLMKDRLADFDEENPEPVKP